MIELNINEINKYGITEQPAKYNSEEELIRWLKYDLLQQAFRNGKEPDKNNIITITDEEEEYYTLNIGIRYDKNNAKNKIIINFDFCIIKCQCNINCHNIIFNKKIYGHDEYKILKILNNKIDFSNSIFNDMVDFTSTIFYNFSIDFSNCLFKDIVKFEGSKFYGGVNSNLYFNDSIFEKKIIFDYSEFYNFFLINYKNAQFLDEASFYETKFKINKNKYSILDFSKAIIHKDIIFRYCDFQDTVLFNNTIFYGNIDMDSAKIGKKIDFFNTEISNEINFDNIIFKNKNTILSINNDKFQKINKINFENIIIDGRINIQNISVNVIDFSGTIINLGLFITVNFKVHKFANRESALFLKQQAYARNNAIDALQYKAKEIECHKNDLIKDWQKNKDFKTFGDIVSIGLSSIYSDNGQNWIKAFICTILFPAMFFTLSYTNFKVGLYFYILLITYAINILFFKDILKYIINSILVYLIACILLPLLYIEITSFDESYIKELFMFLIPTNFEQIKESIYIYNDNTLFRGISYFIGKIAFWYGSVQTVTTFRKFSKGA